jgi:hypothetical protein
MNRAADFGVDASGRRWGVQSSQIREEGSSAWVTRMGTGRRERLPCGTHHDGRGCVAAARGDLRRHVEGRCSCPASGATQEPDQSTDTH